MYFFPQLLQIGNYHSYRQEVLRYKSGTVSDSDQAQEFMNLKNEDADLNYFRQTKIDKTLTPKIERSECTAECSLVDRDYIVTVEG